MVINDVFSADHVNADADHFSFEIYFIFLYFIFMDGRYGCMDARIRNKQGTN